MEEDGVLIGNLIESFKGLAIIVLLVVIYKVSKNYCISKYVKKHMIKKKDLTREELRNIECKAEEVVEKRMIKGVIMFVVSLMLFSVAVLINRTFDLHRFAYLWIFAILLLIPSLYYYLWTDMTKDDNKHKFMFDHTMDYVLYPLEYIGNKMDKHVFFGIISQYTIAPILCVLTYISLAISFIIVVTYYGLIKLYKLLKK